MEKIVGLKNLCAPAQFYLVISLISIFMMIYQNYNGNTEIYCLGEYSCNGNKTIIILTSIVYMLFWTWVLNIICSAGASYVSWFLVLLPFLLFFIVLLLFMFSNISM
jgi:hypothetical protein